MTRRTNRVDEPRHGQQPKHAKITQKSLRRIEDLVEISRDILGYLVVLDAKRDVRSVGDEMIIDFRVSSPVRDTWPLGESRANCPGGYRDSQMGEKSKPWRNSPQLLLSPDCGGKLARRRASAEDEPQQAAYPPVAAGCDNVGGPRVSEATLPEESRWRDPRLSPDPLYCAGRCWPLPSSTYCLVQCTFHPLGR